MKVTLKVCTSFVPPELPLISVILQRREKLRSLRKCFILKCLYRIHDSEMWTVLVLLSTYHDLHITASFICILLQRDSNTRTYSVFIMLHIPYWHFHGNVSGRESQSALIVCLIKFHLLRMMICNQHLDLCGKKGTCSQNAVNIWGPGGLLVPQVSLICLPVMPYESSVWNC